MSGGFCLDIAETRVKVADLIQRDNLLEAQSMGTEKIDPLFFKSDSAEAIEKTAAVVSELLKKLKLGKKNARIVIPDSFSYNQFIEMPLLNEKELFSAIKYQADQFIPMPLNEVNLDIEIIYEDEKEKKMLTLIAASAKKTVEKIQKLAESCGLIPDSVETETSALGRFLSVIYPKKTGEEVQGKGFLIVNLQNSSSSCYFFDESLGLTIYSHNFQMGYALFSKEIQVNLNVESAKSWQLLTDIGLLQGSFDLQTILAPSLKNFTAEIEKSINELVTKMQKKITKIILLNESVNLKGIDQFLSRYFAIPAEYFDPYAFFVKNNVINHFKGDLVYFSTTFGGALF